jgi:hypothetical protein
MTLFFRQSRLAQFGKLMEQAIHVAFTREHAHPIGRNGFDSIGDSREPTGDTARGIRISTEIHRFQNAVTIIVRREETPQTGVQRMEHIPGGNNFALGQGSQIVFQNVIEA